MWRRLRRRSFAPSKPAIYPQQAALVIVVAIAIAGGLWLVLEAFG